MAKLEPGVYYLVWVQGLRGPEMQKWPDNPPIGGKRTILQGPIEITAKDFKCRLKYLADKYPFKGSDGFT